MASKILYANKEELIDDESIPLKNKVTADDMNEIKEVVNSNADDIETLDEEKADVTEIPTDLSELSNATTKFVNETQLANAIDDEKTARQDADNIINNTITTISVDYGKTIELSIDNSTFILTATLKNKNGAELSTSNIDLPIESMIVNGRYDSASKKIILTLQNGNTIEIPVGDLISGLQSEITNNNKLSSDLVDDTNHTNKFVTQTEKNQIETNKTDIATLDENKENISNKVTELTEESTDIQYPSAKAVYDNESALKEKLDRYANTIETELGDSTEAGTDLTLNGTAEFDVDLGFSGNTSQETTEGKNLWGGYSHTATTQGITFKELGDGSISINGTATTNAYSTTIAQAVDNNRYNVIPAGTYTISKDATDYNVTIYDTDSHNIINLDTTTMTGTFTLTETTNIIVRIQVLSETTINRIALIQLEVGSTATEWEKYTGGNPAPNPEYPQNVQVVKGNNEVKLENKNIFKLEFATEQTKVAGLDFSYTNSSFTLKGTTSTTYKIMRLDYIPYVQKGETYIFSKNISGIFSKIQISLTFYGANGNLGIAKLPTTIYTTAFTPNFSIEEVDHVNLTIEALNNNTAYDCYVELQLEKGAEETTWQEHQEQTYPITLPTGMEMCKIGDYADEFVYQNDTWYKNKKIFKLILDGTENWTKAVTKTNTSRFYITRNDIMVVQDTENPALIFNTHFKMFTFGDLYNGDFQGCAQAIQSGQTKRIHLSLNNTYATTVDELNTYLSQRYEQNNPVIVYYILETPILEEITDTTLIEQLNNIKEAYTCQGQTNISQTNEDLPFIITADFKLSNLSRIEVLESALETVSSRVDLLEE